MAVLVVQENKYKWQNFTIEEIKEKIYSSKSLIDFVKKLGYNSYRTVIKNQIISQYPFLSDDLNFLSHGGENLIDQHFGKLTVISFNKEETEKQKHRCWNCICECGRKTVVRGNRLINKEILSCLNCSKREDLTGQKFGFLTVKSLNEDITKMKKDGRVYWNCQCDCGNEKIISSHSLKQNNIISCGCLTMSKGEIKIEQILKENSISFKKQYSFDNLRSKRLLRFDFAIFKDNKLFSLIEFQGQQHFYPVAHFGGEERFIQQQFLDQQKKKYCKQNHINLIEIKYDDYNKINLQYLKKLGAI